MDTESREADVLAADHLFIDPLDRLQRILELGEAALEGRRAELDEVRHALIQLRNRDRAPDQAGPIPVWQTLSADLAPPLLRHLTEETVGMVRSCVVSLDTGPGLDEESIRQSQELLARRRIRQRTIYPMDVLEHQTGRAWVAAWGAFGEEQRLSLAPPSDFAIFDQHAVVAVARWGDPAADYVLIRDPMLISAFTALFDRAYERALPMTPLDEGSEVDLSLMRLLGLGLKDESIARYLGISLRTVRRRIATLMEAHGAQTRFQLGVAAAREDLVAVTGRGDR